MDWSGCNLVEVIEGKVSGAPLVKDTRIPADFVIESFNLTRSVDEVVEEFPRIPREIVLQLVEFAAKHQEVAAA